MKNWLDKFEKGSTLQEYQENYNEASVELPPSFVGMGNNIKGRNYSPAWGGQFEDGGELPEKLSDVELNKKIQEYRHSPEWREKSSGAVEQTIAPHEYFMALPENAIGDALFSGIGKFISPLLKTKIPLRHAEGMAYRGLGQSGFDDAIASGVLRQSGFESGVPKYKGPYFATGEKGIGKANSYTTRGKNTGYIVKYPLQEIPDKKWGYSGEFYSKDHLPLNNAEFFKQNRWGNYKQIDTEGNWIKKENGGELTDKERKRREELYSTVRPSDYSDTNNYLRYMFNTKRKEFDDERSEEAFKQYLRINDNPKYLSPSKYKPSKSTDKNAKYMSFDKVLEEEIFDSLRDSVKLGDSKVFEETDVISNFPIDTKNMNPDGTINLVPGDENVITGRPMSSRARALGHFTVGRNVDEKGNEYLSYYDKYDFPTLFQKTMKGDPYEIYGRIYYPKKQNGGSIPGTVGFTYARTGSTPSEGKYAKKTLPSAEDGKTIQDLGQYRKLNQLINFTNYNQPEPGGWLDKYK